VDVKFSRILKFDNHSKLYYIQEIYFPLNTL